MGYLPHLPSIFALMRKRSLWVDEEVASLTVKQAVVYDPLKDRFSLYAVKMEARCRSLESPITLGRSGAG